VGEATNNDVDMDGIMEGFRFALQNQWTPMVIEGDSRVIVEMARKIQTGAKVSKVARNWRLETRLYQLEDLLISNTSIVSNYVRRESNKVAEWMANHGILDKGEGQAIHWEEIRDMEIRRRGTEIASTYLQTMDAGERIGNERY
jgi:ribonuclease HI